MTQLSDYQIYLFSHIISCQIRMYGADILKDGLYINKKIPPGVGILTFDIHYITQINEFTVLYNLMFWA